MIPRNTEWIVGDNAVCADVVRNLSIVLRSVETRNDSIQFPLVVFENLGLLIVHDGNHVVFSPSEVFVQSVGTEAAKAQSYRVFSKSND